MDDTARDRGVDMNIFDAPWWQSIGSVIFGVLMGWIAKVLHIKSGQ